MHENRNCPSRSIFIILGIVRHLVGLKLNHQIIVVEAAAFRSHNGHLEKNKYTRSDFQKLQSTYCS